MKVVHISLVGYPYHPSWGYQENHMIAAHHKKNHEVVEISMGYVSNLYKEHLKKDETFYLKESFDEQGTKIIRLSYKYKLPFSVNSRIRIYQGLYEILEKEKPDVIFVHDLQFYSLFEITKYKKKHPECILKGDLHVTYENSANHFIAKNLLHKLYYRWIFKKNYKVFDKIYYLVGGALTFISELYGVDIRDDMFEFMPLGGILLSNEEYQEKRKKTRQKHFLNEDEILILHSGKFEAGKRTHEIMQAFKQVEGKKLHLYLIGSIPEGQRSILEKDIEQDKRIQFLGWKSSEELKDYLCAADFYIQAGTESSTLQTAMCCGCPCLLNLQADIPGGGYATYIDETMVFPIKTVEDIRKGIELLSENKEMREKLRKNAGRLAAEKMDYMKQIDKIMNKE